MPPAHRSNPVLAPGERFWRPFFCKTKKKIILIKRRRKSKKQKLLEMIKFSVLFQTDQFILFGLSKTETGAKTAPRVLKLGYFDGRVPTLRSRVTHATSGAGMVCHMYINIILFNTKHELTFFQALHY